MRRTVLLGLAVAAVAAAGLFWVGRPGPEPGVRAGLTVAEAMGGGSTAGFARADGPRTFRFPEDHGPHPEMRTEWWYVTGNLQSAAGRRFGYQVTLFRSALAPDPPQRASAWATRDAWLGHLGVTDVAAGRFHSHERLARGALGLAGARAAPLEVWVEGWRIAAAPGAAPDDPVPRLEIAAAAGEVALDLELESRKPPVLQGRDGWSIKGREPGNASYYYSLTRLATRGTLTVGGDAHRVVGESWLDREWSTSALEPGQVGWDWFALQLDDGRELMFYRLRRADGSTDPLSAGRLVAADGSSRPLAEDDVVLEDLDRWQSPRTGAVYPLRWRLRVPAENLELRVEPYLEDQEHRTAIVYWEGAVAVRGRAGGRPVSGRGYAELTGYAAGAPGPAGRPRRAPLAPPGPATGASPERAPSRTWPPSCSPRPPRTPRPARRRPGRGRPETDTPPPGAVREVRYANPPWSF